MAITSPTPSMALKVSTSASCMRFKSWSKKRQSILALATPMLAMPSPYITLGKVVRLARSTLSIRFWYDFSPNPSVSTICSRYLSRWKRSANSWINPMSMNFSSVASDRPSMFMASRLTKRVNALICLAAHFSLVQ